MIMTKIIEQLKKRKETLESEFDKINSSKHKNHNIISKLVWIFMEIVFIEYLLGRSESESDIDIQEKLKLIRNYGINNMFHY